METFRKPSASISTNLGCIIVLIYNMYYIVYNMYYIVYNMYYIVYNMYYIVYNMWTTIKLLDWQFFLGTSKYLN